jgi:predicted ABC-type ATPase
MSLRVSKGGHNIPETDIERRYYRGIKNLPEYVNAVDNWYVYDNSNGDYSPIAKRVGKNEIIANFEKWREITRNEQRHN